MMPETETPIPEESEPFIDAPEPDAAPHDEQPVEQATEDAAAASTDPARTAEPIAETRAADTAPVFDGPYDAAAALTEIFKAEDAVEKANGEYERKAGAAKGAKDELNLKREMLDRLIKRFRDQSRGVQREQPRLATVREDAPETIAGRDAALQSLAFALLGRQCFIDVAELAKLSDADRGALHDWATSKRKGPVLPAVLFTAHVAREDGIACAKCGLVFPRETADPAFVAKSLIGLDCKGADLDDYEVVQPRRRAAKRAKVDHDGERQAQAVDGKKRAAKKAKKRG